MVWFGVVVSQVLTNEDEITKSVELGVGLEVCVGVVKNVDVGDAVLVGVSVCVLVTVGVDVCEDVFVVVGVCVIVLDGVGDELAVLVGVFV